MDEQRRAAQLAGARAPAAAARAASTPASAPAGSEMPTQPTLEQLGRHRRGRGRSSAIAPHTPKGSPSASAPVVVGVDQRHGTARAAATRSRAGSTGTRSARSRPSRSTSAARRAGASRGEIDHIGTLARQEQHRQPVLAAHERKLAARRASACTSGSVHRCWCTSIFIAPSSRSSWVSAYSTDSLSTLCDFSTRSNKRPAGRSWRSSAGDPGVEPRVTVLETAVLPIHQSPGQARIVGARGSAHRDACALTRARTRHASENARGDIRAKGEAKECRKRL